MLILTVVLKYVALIVVGILLSFGIVLLMLKFISRDRRDPTWVNKAMIIACYIALALICLAVTSIYYITIYKVGSTYVS